MPLDPDVMPPSLDDLVKLCDNRVGVGSGLCDLQSMARVTTALATRRIASTVA